MTNRHGPVAQLGERLHGMEEVAGSTPVGSTFRRRGFVLGGLVSGEGSYYVTRKQPPFKDGTERKDSSSRYAWQSAIARSSRSCGPSWVSDLSTAHRAPNPIGSPCAR